MKGTFVNAITILIGSIIGLFINKKLPDNLIKIVFNGIGLFTLYLGFSMALKAHNILIIVFSIIIGAIIGEIINIDRGINNLSNIIKSKIKSKNDKFTEGLITAFGWICIFSFSIKFRDWSFIFHNSPFFVCKPFPEIIHPNYY